MFVKERRGVYDLLDLRNDFVFKSFFGDKRNSNLLLQFLNSILDVQVTSIELVDPHLEYTHAGDKSSVMDVRVRTEQGEQINIEMQLGNHQAFPERMLIYWAKMYGSQDNKSRPYTQLRKAIQIIITDFNLLKEKDYHNLFQIANKKSNLLLSDHLEIHVLELPKLRIENIMDASELERWLLFMKSDDKTKEALAMESPTMREAFEEIDRLSQNPETRRLADFREQELKDILQREEDAREKGMEMGIEKEKRDTVISLNNFGMSPKDIAINVRIPLEKVIEIVKSLKQ
ncbi:Rpn family recombination-promoting nuclease/putative transposase [Sporosarcina sp. Marseille-Q4063]|uniref:Rpn family recombination-promoting nuclease/putative transposase n=1 Tax=Sporosarcina sp. Marseille-Q4063 TaxID=2810514 RepID=UPI0020168BF0|nr:Rpn family recombination-promoting nuclease/putative transposase [Sporosarcina sp. Marseille-Q4063]